MCHATPRIQLVPLGSEDDTRNSRIVGGSNAAEFPIWQVSLRNTNSHTCGAVIVDTTTVLTAAHCVDGNQNNPNKFTIGVGHLNLNNHDIYGVSSITMHGSYKSGGGAHPNDIAILKISSEIKFGSNVGPITMYNGNSNDLAESTCTLTGWGKLSGTSSGLPTYLQETSITLKSDTTCRSYWGNNINSNAHVCVLDNRGQAGACNGDSGGPLTCTVDGTPYLVGLASWVYSGCVTSYPSVYVDVANYLSWVSSNS